MTIDLSPHKVQTFPGINDTAVEPTSSKGGNGSHLIGKHNGLIDAVTGSLTSIDTDLNTLSGSVTSLSGNVTTLTTAVNNTPSVEALYPTTYIHWHTDSIVTNGGALTTLNFSDQPFNTVVQQSPSAYYDHFKFSALLKAGSYKMKITGRSSTNGGYFLVYLNNFSTPITASGLDLYMATPAPIYFTVNFTTATSGVHSFLFRQQSGASGRNELPLTRMYISPV